MMRFQIELTSGRKGWNESTPLLTTDLKFVSSNSGGLMRSYYRKAHGTEKILNVATRTLHEKELGRNEMWNFVFSWNSEGRNNYKLGRTPDAGTGNGTAYEIGPNIE